MPQGLYRTAVAAGTGPAASIEVLANPDPQAGNTLAAPDAVVPARGTRHGTKGVFSYLVPANSLTVVKVAR